MKRKDGYYWIIRQDATLPEIAKYNDGFWKLYGYSKCDNDRWLSNISPNPIPSEDECKVKEQTNAEMIKSFHDANALANERVLKIRELEKEMEQHNRIWKALAKGQEINISKLHEKVSYLEIENRNVNAAYIMVKNERDMAFRKISELESKLKIATESCWDEKPLNGSMDKTEYPTKDVEFYKAEYKKIETYWNDDIQVNMKLMDENERLNKELHAELMYSSRQKVRIEELEEALSVKESSTNQLGSENISLNTGRIKLEIRIDNLLTKIAQLEAKINHPNSLIWDEEARRPFIDSIPDD